MVPVSGAYLLARRDLALCWEHDGADVARDPSRVGCRLAPNDVNLSHLWDGRQPAQCGLLTGRAQCRVLWCAVRAAWCDVC